MKRSDLFLALLACGAMPGLVHADILYKGMSYMNFSSPSDFNTTASDNAMIGIQQVDANTVALNIWDFTPSLTSTSIAPNNSKYSSPDAEVEYAINYIHSLGMNVMLKPMLDVNNGTWRGMINPSAANVNTWFTNYQAFIDHYATIAEQNVNNGVTLFSVGCELNNMEQYSSNWTTLISSVRGIYSGKLTYSANWSVNNLNNGGYTKISWWNQLDYVGIDAYFPLTTQTDPSETQLLSAWGGVANNISSWRQTAGLTNEPVLFTEAGYEAKPGTNENPSGVTSSLQDITEQADCYNALLTTMSAEPWWDGVFWWNWAPGTIPSTDNSFTPENKPQTLSVLESFYVPEPGSLAMAIFGIALLQIRRRSPSLKPARPDFVRVYI